MGYEEAIAMCKENYGFFKSKFELLYEKYPEQFIVIHNMEVQGGYATFDEAFNAAVAKYEEGDFIVQYCTKRNVSANFASNNISFAGA